MYVRAYPWWWDSSCVWIAFRRIWRLSRGAKFRCRLRWALRARHIPGICRRWKRGPEGVWRITFDVMLALDLQEQYAREALYWV